MLLGEGRGFEIGRTTGAARSLSHAVHRVRTNEPWNDVQGSYGSRLAKHWRRSNHILKKSTLNAEEIDKPVVTLKAAYRWTQPTKPRVLR
jgi:hypothetical protein